MVEGHEDALMTFTTAADLAAVIAQAIDYESGEWPEISGIRGNQVTASRVVEIGQNIRGTSLLIRATEAIGASNTNITSMQGLPLALTK